MGSVGDFVKRAALATATFGLSEVTGLSDSLKTPDAPKVKKPPTEDPAEVRKRAEEAARKRRQRAKAGFAFSDTFLTGQSGLGSGGTTLGAPPGLSG